MFISMFSLSILTIFVGFFFSDLYSGYGSPFFLNSIFILPIHFMQIEQEFLPIYIKLLPLIVSLLGSLLIILFFYLNKYLNKYLFIYLIKINFFLYKFFFPAGFFNYIYNFFFIQFIFFRILYLIN